MKKLPQLDSSRSGMALVIVLGLISLLIISSVTFAILMRVERASSANARNTMMARQIVKAALYNSIATISANIGDAAYPEWYDSNKPEKPYWKMYSTKTDKALGKKEGREIHFWKDTFGSIDHNVGTSPEGARAPALVMTYSAERYLPYAIRHRAYARAMSEGGKSTGGVKDIAPEWIPVATDADDVSKEGDSELDNNASKNQNIVGRYAFMAFNTTEYLDLSAMISEYTKAKDKPVRFMGSSVAELSLKSDFFRKGTTPDKFFKDNEKVGRYDTVAEILDHNRKDADKEGENDSVFADGTTFSAFSYMPKEHAPRKSDRKKDKTANGLTFREKIYIGMNDPAEPSEELKGGQLEHIKKHKARIIKAFYDSGLRTSSGEYKEKAISEPACDICGTAAYTLPAKYNSEQALWAYLGLLDYIDEDGEPAGDNDKERYARPATEATPLFTGFMVAVRLTRGDVVKEEDYELPSGATEKRKVVVQGKVGVSAEVVSKVVYTDRFGKNAGADLIGDAIYESKIAIWFDDGNKEVCEKVWKKDIANYLKDKGLGVKDTELDDGLLEDIIVGVLESEDYPDTPRVVMNFKYEEEVDVSGYPGSNTGGDLEKAVEFPEVIFASAASQIEMPDGVTQRIPAEDGIYENDGYDQWITANVEPEVIEIKGNKVRVNVGDTSPNYQVKTNVVNLVLWGEMLDPRFLHLGAYDKALAWAQPKVSLVSNDQNEAADGFLDDYEKFPEYKIFKDMKNLMGDNNSFITEFKKFRDDDDYFILDYFETEDIDGAGYYSQFHKLFLQNSEDILSKKDYFGGHIDGSHLGTEISDDESDSEYTDGFMKQWCTMHVKNAPLETVGELGHLPIGPWATIRLTGFNSEVEEGKKFKADDFWNNFNQLPEVYSAKKDDGDDDEEDDDVTIPFHPVLDYFTTRGATRGLINLNSPDPATLAMAFYDMPLDTETLSAVDDKDCDVIVTDSDAEDFASVLLDSWSQHNEDEDEPVPFSRLSQLGYAFETDPEVLGGVAEPSNYYREAAIRNSCGLFTTRGMTFTIIMRGEAFTPTFGRIAVSDEAGTTHATRTAIAQVWRDTEKNEDGIYPFFIQYFKILDD